MILKTSLGFFENNFSPKTAVPLFSCNCFQRPPFILCCLPLWSSELDFQNLKNFITRNIPTRRHAPRLSPANPPVLIFAATSRLLRLSCARHPRIRLVKTNLHQKYRRQKTPHAPVKLSACFLYSEPHTLTRPVIRPAPRPACSVSCWRQPYILLTLALAEKKKKKKKLKITHYFFFFVLFCRYFLYSLFISNG